MATMADAYANFFYGTASRPRQRAQSSQSATTTMSIRSMHRSYSEESFIDLSLDYAALQAERRRSSLPSTDHLDGFYRSTPVAGHTESTSELVKNRMKVWWHNVKYGWTVMSPGTLIVMNDFNGNEPVYLLGQAYGSRDDPSSFRNFFSDFTTRIWFTYRQDFTPISETGHQSDSGWGCMLRTAQMLLAQAFMLHLLGRDWRWSAQRSTGIIEDEHGVHRKIISWFGDDADAREAPFGIHSLVRAAGRISKKRAG
ncbi:cysteine protease ATG4D-like [Tropilaelaps mercedesae]|uniref:Cysteine protease n=1 Tax=Tropilaelaps mercedesae TaxID=418985 RepID=A0A1V9X5I9_9ACAR|nr:cysteine protease ATG4D-like [Tropilaelaps mercedesae]